MSEVLAQFAEPVVSDKGVRYRAQACGAPRPTGLWEGWIEFIPVDGGEPVRSPRETTQPNKTDAVYWATGLTGIYLEGALRRALEPLVVKTTPPALPIFDTPAPDLTSVDAVPVAPRAVLDPFSVYATGEGLLRQELNALSAWHLVNIVVAYQLSYQPVRVLNRLPGATLVDLIVNAVRAKIVSRNQ